MTRKEWMEKNLPSYVKDYADGGVIGCPTTYNELVRIDPSVRTNKPCKGCHNMTSFVCELCWNTKLNVKEERRTTMTRREFVIQNYGKEVANNTIASGIHGCPGHYPKLVALDPSCNALCIGQPSCKDNGLTCTECWNAPLTEEGGRPSDKVEIRKTIGAPHIGDIFYTIAPIILGKYQRWNAPIPQQPKDEVPMPVVGGQFWTFVRVNFSPNTDLLVVGNFVIVALMRANSEIRVVARDETLNLEYIFFYDPEKKSIRKIPRDSALEKKYPEIDFTIYWDEESMNKAKRGIVTDREYTNQYILLMKGESK